MKIYRLTEHGKLIGEYKTKIEAVEAMNNNIALANDKVNEQDDELTPFDFELKAVKVGNDSDYEGAIMSFEEARKYLGLEQMVDSALLSNDLLSKSSILIVQLMQELNPHHVKAFIALNRLFTIAEAQNKVDGFVPDFARKYQYKWIPWVKWSQHDARFVPDKTSLTAWSMSACLCSQICFKSSTRASQFASQFVDLYNDVLQHEDDSTTPGEG